MIAILTDYIIPMIYDSFITLIIVLLVLFLFRIRDSGMRILFLFLPLLKPLLIVTEKFETHSDTGIIPDIYSGLRIPDPNNLFRWFKEVDESKNFFIADINYLLIIIIVLSILLLLIVRWFNLYLLYRKLAYEDKVSRDEIPLIYNIIDDFSDRLSIRPPDISLTHRRYHSPFVVGIKYCTIVIYPTILELLEQEEKEILLYHELAHIKRRDNLIGWIAMILRDLMFFNPFAYIAYSLIRAEQDKGSDKLIVSYTNKPVKEIAKAFLNIVKKLEALGEPGSLPDAASGFTNAAGRFIAHFRLNNRIKSILRNERKRIRMKVFPRIMMYILFILILVLQMMLVINAGQYHLYLR